MVKNEIDIIIFIVIAKKIFQNVSVLNKFYIGSDHRLVSIQIKINR